MLILFQSKKESWDNKHQYSLIILPILTRPTSVPSNKSWCLANMMLPVSERITPLRRSSQIVPCPPRLAKDSSNKDNLPSSPPAWQPHGNSVVASIPSQHRSELIVDKKDKDSYAYTAQDIENYLMATGQKKTRAANFYCIDISNFPSAHRVRRWHQRQFIPKIVYLRGHWFKWFWWGQLCSAFSSPTTQGKDEKCNCTEQEKGSKIDSNIDDNGNGKAHSSTFFVGMSLDASCHSSGFIVLNRWSGGVGTHPRRYCC